MTRDLLNKIVEKTEREIEPYIDLIRDCSLANHARVLRSFRELNVSDFCFNGSTGYGYGDVSRDTWTTCMH